MRRNTSMKRTMKKSLCLVLALLMFVGIMSVGAFAESKPVQYNSYTVLGDSIASGYGLPSYEAKVNPRNGLYICEDVIHDGSYGQIVGDELGAATKSSAHSGWRAIDYLKMMGYSVGKDYNVGAGEEIRDPYFFIEAMGWLSYENGYTNRELGLKLKDAGSRVISDIKNKDLITLNLGCNDIFSYAQAVAMYTVSNRLGWSSIYSPAGAGTTVSALGKALSEGDVKELVSTYVKALETGSDMYETYMPQLIKAIKTLNPKATICVIGLANPVNVNIPIDFKEYGINLYNHFDYYSARENTFLKGLCDDTGCIFVDVADTDNYGIKYFNFSSVLTLDMLGIEVSGIKMVHPTPEGHAYIARKILEALPEHVKGNGTTVTPSGNGLPFTDVPTNAWYYDELAYCYGKGIAKGTTDTTFSPNKVVTRAQLATFLYRMAGSPSVKGQSEPFSDVSDSFWAHNAIVWAYNAGVVKGTTSTTFAPNDPVTRGQAVTMLCRYSGEKNSSNSYSQFKDASSIPTDFCGAVSWAVDNNVIQGYQDGCFHSNYALSRAQMVVILARYDQNT